MMVLELFIWGAWLPLVWKYLDAIGFTTAQQLWIGSTFGISSILAIFFSNQFADRNFSAERFLAFSHLIGGLAILGLYFTRDFGVFFTLMLVHSLFYLPTLSVTDSIAFANLSNPQRDFGFVQMGGAIGWILAAWPLYGLLHGKIGAELVAARSCIFIVSGVASLILAAFCFTLPHTPPKPAVKEEDRFAWLESVKLLGIPYLFVLYLVTFLDSTIHNGYFLMADSFLEKTGFNPEITMPVMSIGQVAEIASMAVLGLVLKRFGWKATCYLVSAAMRRASPCLLLCLLIIR